MHDILWYGAHDNIESKNSKPFHQMIQYDSKKLKFSTVPFQKGNRAPSKRWNHDFCSFRGSNRGFIVCGCTTEGLTNEIYSVDLTTMYFTKLNLEGKKIPPLELHSAVVFRDTHLFIMGGKTSQTTFNKDMFIVDLETLIVDDVFMPEFICAHTTCIIDDRYLLSYGGWNGKRIVPYFIRYDIPETNLYFRWTRMVQAPPNMTT